MYPRSAVTQRLPPDVLRITNAHKCLLIQMFLHPKEKQGRRPDILSPGECSALYWPGVFLHMWGLVELGGFK